MSFLDANEPQKAGHWVLIIWPAFLAACLLEALVFAVIDPGEIHWPGSFLQPARQSVYAVAFFSFWLITMGCSGLVLWLAKPGPKITDTPAD